jgi:hypothetical protein
MKRRVDRTRLGKSYHVLNLPHLVRTINLRSYLNDKIFVGLTLCGSDVLPCDPCCGYQLPSRVPGATMMINHGVPIHLTPGISITSWLRFILPIVR